MTGRFEVFEAKAGSTLGPADFRRALATFPAGVVVVTATEANGRPVGLTVSAFCSVSAEPPLVLVCVDKGSNTLPAILDSGMFTVNILNSDSEDLALLFASKTEEKFTEVIWHMPRALDGGGPILHSDAASYLVCTVDQAIEAGDHWVMIGAVREAAVHEAPRPLVYHQRTFFTVSG